MDALKFRQRILDGEVGDDELSALLSPRQQKRSGGFLKTVLKGFVDAYTAPMMYRLALQALLILTVIVGTLLLSYWGRIDATITAVLLAFVLGFIFGKIK